MRAFLVLLLVLAVVFAVTAGCSKKQTYKAPGGDEEVTVEEKGGGKGKVTVKGKEGEKMTMETGASKVSEEELGLPIYPGAEQTGSMNWSLSAKEEGGSVSTVSFTTKDAYDKVLAFYKDKVKNPTMSAETKDEDGKRTAVLSVITEKEKRHLIVSVKETDEGAEILVQRMQQSG
jgi:uncharacterized protein YebE (UPF0316 family)